MIGLREQFIIL